MTSAEQDPKRERAKRDKERSKKPKKTSKKLKEKLTMPRTKSIKKQKA